MADDFVDFPVVSTEEALADLALERLQTEWPDWEPEDSDLAVIQIEALATLAQNAAEAASNMTSAAFRAYGTKLIGEPYDQGTVAVAELTFTVIDNAGYTVEAGFEVDIDGFIFVTVEDAVIPALSTSVSGVEAHAAFETAEANGLTGDLVVAQTDIAYVVSVDLDTATTTSGGSDAQDDEAYQDALARTLLLQAKTLVTTRDYELMAFEEAGIGRAVAVQDVPNRQIDVVVINDTDGGTVSAPIKTALAGLYEAYRLTNWTVSVGDAMYTVINATVGVKAYPGFDLDDLETRVGIEVARILSPEGWGAVSSGLADPVIWHNQVEVRLYKIIDLIGNIPGVDYVTGLLLSNPSTSGLTATASTDLLHKTNHGLTADAAISIDSLTGGAGLSTGTTYYVIASGLTANDFKLSATDGGSAINITSDGSAGTYHIAEQVSGLPGGGSYLLMPGVVGLPTPGTINVTAT
jgi:hypothetical protein